MIDQKAERAPHTTEIENTHGESIPNGDMQEDGKLQKKLLLKQDLALVVLLSGCYWFAYLVSAYVLQTAQVLIIIQDRGAIGNARVMGFQKDLNVTSTQFYNCLMMFCKSSATEVYSSCH